MNFNIIFLNIIIFTVTFLSATNFTTFADENINKNINTNIKISDTISDKRATVALVLSGGGARGAAHIGMLKCLEDNNVKIDYVVGTSIGAVIGGLYSAGYSAAQIDSIFNEIDWQNLFKIRQQNKRKDVFFEQKKIEDRSILTLHFNNFKFISPEAFSQGEVLNSFFLSYFLDSDFYYVSDFNQLKYPFRAIATDLAKGKSVALKSGNLAKMIRASSTLPINYAPVKIGDMILIDGGLMANIPVSFAKEFSPDLIIAMDATSPILAETDINTPLKIAEQAVSVSMNNFAEKDANLADILIKPEIENIEYLDFSNLKKIIDCGYAATVDKVSEINHKINEINRKINEKNLLQTKKITKVNENIVISEIDVTYNKQKQLNELTVAFPIKIGDTLTKEKMINCYNFFENENQYDDIDIQIVTVENKNVMKIQLSEFSNQALSISGRTDNERTINLGIDFITKNIFRSNFQNQITLQASNINRYAAFSVFYPNLFNNITTNFTFYYAWNDINIYHKNNSSSYEYSLSIIDTNFIKRQGFRVTVGSQIEKKGLFNAEYRFENQSFGKKKVNDTISKLQVSNNNTVSLLGFSLYYDSENLPFFATSGGIINLILETNLFSQNSYSQFSKLQAFFKTNINFDKHNIAPSILFGAGDENLPYPELFSLGGLDNFFGLRENEELGRQIFRVSAEYRYELPHFLSILGMKSFFSLRYDLGSVWENPAQIRISTLKHGIGGFLSLDTPVGPAIFAIGRAWNFVRTANNAINFKFGSPLLYFSLGVKI